MDVVHVGSIVLNIEFCISFFVNTLNIIIEMYTITYITVHTDVHGQAEATILGGV